MPTIEHKNDSTRLCLKRKTPSNSSSAIIYVFAAAFAGIICFLIFSSVDKDPSQKAKSAMEKKQFTGLAN
jgi:hypothetical protein|tara:strand:+ start:545 stop:754 length:210 start_codon:yes stop_codon:yes gene_type:complete